MKIKGKSIRSLTKLKNLTGNISLIRLVFDVSSFAPELWESVGFDKELNVGDYLMPETIGKVTGFNSNGKEIVRKDLPKEPQPRTSFRTWKDWHGREHSGIQTRLIEMYPREYLQAPSEFLHIIELSGKKYIATDETATADKHDQRNLHLSNLMLECFGEFQIVDNAEQTLVGNKIRMLHWEILPKGDYPWEKAKPLIGEITKKLSKSDKMVIESRMQFLSNFKPDFLATGRGGFSGYFVYGFESKSCFVLESLHLDNATYIFGNDWEKLSQLTKNQIINGDIPHERIVHDKRWKQKLRKKMS